MELAAGRILPALQKSGWLQHWKSPEELAHGVIDVVNNNMEQAIRLISVERGYDPRDFTLFCFGGAGGLHAASLSSALGMQRVVVPRFPGALSALGLLLADVRKDYSRTLLIDADLGSHKLKSALRELHKRGQMELETEGFKKAEIHAEDFVDLRYRGQSYELTVPLGSRLVEVFNKAHQRRYGYSTPGRDVELVNVRAVFVGRKPRPHFRKAPRQRGKPEPMGTRLAWLGGKQTRTRIYDRQKLGHGQVVEGPAIIGEYSSTTLVPANCRCVVDPYLNLLLET
jgi:N-methylhydantoinase A